MVVIIFNILDNILKFFGKKKSLALPMVEMNRVRIRICQNEADPTDLDPQHC
jgi:hypothetical protein